jgi:hypothetical protein
MVLSINCASQELALREQGETVKGLEQTVEAGRRALEVERKQVEGKSLFGSRFAGFLLEGSHPFSDLPIVFLATPGLRTALGPRRCRPPTTPPSKSCRSCAMRPSRPAGS